MTIPLRNRQPSATMRRRDLDYQEKMKVGRQVYKSGQAVLSYSLPLRLDDGFAALAGV